MRCSYIWLALATLASAGGHPPIVHDAHGVVPEYPDNRLDHHDNSHFQNPSENREHHKDASRFQDQFGNREYHQHHDGSQIQNQHGNREYQQHDNQAQWQGHWQGGNSILKRSRYDDDYDGDRRSNNRDDEEPEDRPRRRKGTRKTKNVNSGRTDRNDRNGDDYENPKESKRTRERTSGRSRNRKERKDTQPEQEGRRKTRKNNNRDEDESTENNEGRRRRKSRKSSNRDEEDEYPGSSEGRSRRKGRKGSNRDEGGENTRGNEGRGRRTGSEREELEREDRIPKQRLPVTTVFEILPAARKAIAGEVAPQLTADHPPINDKEFCAAVRGMGWIASGLTSEAVKLTPGERANFRDELYDQSGPAAVTARMLQRWEAVLNALKAQLAWTPTFSNQMHCAACYAEYCKGLAKWLVAVRKQAEFFEHTHPVRRVFQERLEKLAAAHLAVAKMIHEHSESLINERIPQRDDTGWAEKLRMRFDLRPGTILRIWLQQRDPIFPFPVGGIFRDAILAWHYAKRPEKMSYRRSLPDVESHETVEVEQKAKNEQAPCESQHQVRSIMPRDDDDDDDDDDYELKAARHRMRMRTMTDRMWSLRGKEKMDRRRRRNRPVSKSMGVNRPPGLDTIVIHRLENMQPPRTEETGPFEETMGHYNETNATSV
ncbi:hypothetical protein HIM_02192 [Hirsutella minnesotensis 3608]|nr:hypothetical protein HIM_02192 [Hirsutella minnesotensis 3608]